MTISDHIKNQYFSNEEQLIRLAPSQPPPLKPTKRKGTPWTDDEHNRFLEALEKYPAGPWKLIAEHVRTRTTRQTMTHAQRYREKIARRKRIMAEAGLSAHSPSPSPSPHPQTQAQTPTHAYSHSQALGATASAASSQSRLSMDESDSDGDDGDDGDDCDGSNNVENGGYARRDYIDRLDTAASGSASASALLATADCINISELEDFEDIEDEQLLLSLVEAFEPLPFSAEEAHWLTEHYGSVSL